MDASYNIGLNIHIHNILRQKNDLWALQFFDFFYLISSTTGYTIQTHSFYFLFPSCICWHVRKQKYTKSVNILILLFYNYPS